MVLKLLAAAENAALEADADRPVLRLVQIASALPCLTAEFAAQTRRRMIDLTTQGGDVVTVT